MKKLLIALTAIASFAGVSFANDTGFISGTSFESLTPGKSLNVSADDRGQGSGAKYWTFGGSDSPGTISNDVITVASRPAEWTGTDIDQDGKSKFLSVDTSDLLQRNIDVIDGSAQDIGDGIYVDTVVQFTASDAATIETDAADKLVVWMQTVDHDADGDIEAYTETNLIVTAGSYATGSLEAANYIVSVDGIEVLPGEWHRLTIKSMKVGSTLLDGIAAFVVYIDGVPATCENLDGAFGSIALSAVAAKWAGEDALFPSLAPAGYQVSQTITSLGVEGSGFIDDISFTTQAPDFAADGKLFTVAWTDGVKSFKYTVGDGEATAVSDLAKAGSLVVTFPADFATVTISDVVYDTDNGYAAGAWTMSGVEAFSGSVFTPNADGQTGTIVAKQACFEVGGETFDSFADALAAAESGDTITLLTTVVLGEAESLTFNQDMDVVLDLHGNSISDADENESEPTIWVSAGSLTIIDSVGGGVISGKCEDSGCVCGEADLMIGKVEGDLGATIEGIIFAGDMAGAGEFGIVRGKFVDDGTKMFSYTDYLMDSVCSSEMDENDCWVVTPNGEDTTTYSVTWFGGENVVVSVVVGEEEIESGMKFEDGTEVLFSVTAKPDYEFAEESYEDWALESGVLTRTVIIDGQNVEILIPTPTQKEEPVVENVTITITPNSKTSYAITSGTDPVEVKNDEAIVEKGSVYDVTATVTVDGYEFAAATGDWSLSEGKLTLSVDYAEEATIVIPTPTAIAYTITYMEGEAAAVFAESAEVATTYTIEAAVTLPTADAFATRDGATFAGWFDNAEFSGNAVTTIAAGSKGAKTFYAKWDKVAPGGWDIPGTEGGINGIPGEGDAKYVEFSSIAFTATGATVGLKAGKIDANGQIFGLVCKTALDGEEFVINATLTAETDATEGLFTISTDLSGYTQLFVIGVGPAAKPE